jgi:hypothetical protein
MATIPQTQGNPAVAPAAPTPVAAPAPPTGAAAADNQVAPPPKDNFAPRKFASSSTVTSSGTPNILRLASTQPFYTVTNLATSHYVPSLINLFAILATMDAQMVNTHKFTQSNPNWHPLISQLFISMMVYIHVIRCMMESDPANF